MLMSVQQINGISQEVLDHFGQYLSELTIARQRDEHFEADVTDLMKRLR